MQSKRGKMHGVLVDNDEVLARTGHPSEWARDARKLEKEQRLVPGQTDLRISAIRGYGVREVDDVSYLGFLEQQLRDPDGVGTSLVSAEENERIRALVLAETQAEIDLCMRQLEALGGSARAVNEYIGDMRKEIEKLKHSGGNGQACRLQLLLISHDIRRYQGMLSALETGT